SPFSRRRRDRRSALDPVDSSTSMPVASVKGSITALVNSSTPNGKVETTILLERSSPLPPELQEVRPTAPNALAAAPSCSARRREIDGDIERFLPGIERLTTGWCRR